MTLTKAQLFNADTSTRVVDCQFNPSELTISKSNQWQSSHSSTTPLPDMTFQGEGPSSFTLNLTFDSYEQRQDVRHLTDAVLSLMSASVEERGPQNNVSKRPPHVMFTWGNFSTFPAVIEKIDQKFTLFLDDGRPARATLTVSLKEVPKKRTKEQGQNPTSRAAGASRVHVVQLGDTIDLIAADALGDPGAWRTIAEANDLDDPRRLNPGRALLIPSEW
jgi:hypothetical protein